MGQQQDVMMKDVAELRWMAELQALITGRYKGDPDFMMSLARGLQVLQAFRPQQSPLSISQLSQLTGIPRAAVRR